MIKIGENNITMKVGSDDVSAAYLGNELVYSGGTPPTFQVKWLATYTGGTTSSAECDSTSAISQNEITLTDLESVEIGDCVTSIGDNAFYQCSGLTSVDIPSSVTSIGNSAFYSCSSLTSITINATVPPSVTWATFDGSYPIYVPSESVETYKTADIWKFAYASRIQPIP